MPDICAGRAQPMHSSEQTGKSPAGAMPDTQAAVASYRAPTWLQAQAMQV